MGNSQKRSQQLCLVLKLCVHAKLCSANFVTETHSAYGIPTGAILLSWGKCLNWNFISIYFFFYVCIKQVVVLAKAKHRSNDVSQMKGGWKSVSKRACYVEPAAWNTDPRLVSVFFDCSRMLQLPIYHFSFRRGFLSSIQLRGGSPLTDSIGCPLPSTSIAWFVMAGSLINGHTV